MNNLFLPYLRHQIISLHYDHNIGHTFDRHLLTTMKHQCLRLRRPSVSLLSRHTLAITWIGLLVAYQMSITNTMAFTTTAAGSCRGGGGGAGLTARATVSSLAQSIRQYLHPASSLRRLTYHATMSNSETSTTTNSAQNDYNSLDSGKDIINNRGNNHTKPHKSHSPSSPPPPPDPSTFPLWSYEPRSFFHFEILHQSSRSLARVGRIHTPHGIIDTPSYVAVATNGALKGVDFRSADEANQQLIFCNTYHLLLQPGAEVVEKAGGLHKFVNRKDRPLITDSG